MILERIARNMDSSKQRLLLECLISDQPLFSLCDSIIKPSYFDPTLRQTVSFVKEYFEKYNKLPNINVIKVETGLTLETYELGKEEGQYVTDELEKFCRNKAIEHAILNAPSLLEKEDFGQIMQSMQNAISVGLVKDLGLEYFHSPEERLKRQLENPNVYSTGWKEVDDALDGGICRQELIEVMANSGVGKSVTMLNLARNLLRQGLNGIYISLEMSDAKVANRADAILSGFSNKEILEHISEVSAAVLNASSKYGRFWVKRMPESTTTASHIRTYIIEFYRVHGFIPDFIVVDYLDLMTTNKKIDLDNLFVKDKYVAEEVRGLGLEFDAMMISASQMGRGALEAEEINQGHIQGGISKVNTVDTLIALLQTDMMKAAGEFIFEFVKTRNSDGKGKKVLLRWNRRTLELTDNVDSSGNLIKSSRNLNPVTKPDYVMERAEITKAKPVSGLDKLMRV